MIALIPTYSLLLSIAMLLAATRLLRHERSLPTTLMLAGAALTTLTQIVVIYPGVVALRSAPLDSAHDLLSAHTLTLSLVGATAFTAGFVTFAARLSRSRP